MAINFSKPATADNYSTAFVPNIQANQIALAQMLDSANTTITGTPPTYAKRYNRTSSAVEEYNGSAWAPITFNGFIVNSAGVGRGGTPIAPFHQFGQNASSIGALFTSAAGVGSVGNGANIALVNAGTQGQVRSNWYYNGVDAAAQAGYSPYTVWNFTTGEIDFFRTTNVSAGAGIAPTLTMRLDASGNVGIGVAPSYRLDVRQAAYGTLGYFRNSTGGQYTEVSADSFGPYIGFGNGSAGFRVFDGATERLRIDASGNVGIGAVPTQGRLDVAGGIRATTGLNISGNGGFYNAASKFGIDVNGATARFYASGIDASTRGGYEFHITDSTGALDVVALQISSSGHMAPGVTNAQTLGTTGLRWSTVNSVLGNFSGAITGLSFDTAAATDLLLKPAGTTKATLSVAGAFTLASQPGFRAYGGSGVTVGTGGSYVDVVFPTEEFDNGNCYNNATGAFTAPVAGRYQVTFSLCPRFVSGTAAGELFNATLTKNGTVIDSTQMMKLVASGGIVQDGPHVRHTQTYLLAASDVLRVSAGFNSSSNFCISSGLTFSAILLN